MSFPCLTAIVLVSISVLNISVEARCNLKLISYPDGPYLTLLQNYRYTLKCTFRASCRPELSYEYNLLVEDETFRPVHSDYYLVTKGYVFLTKLSSSGDEYSIELVIDPFRSRYAGVYRCGIGDVLDPSNQIKQSFRVYVVELAPLPTHAQCYLPLVQNISVSSNDVYMGGLRFFMQWELTEKKDPELSYCVNSKKWRVRVLSFPSVTAAPADHEVIQDTSVKWINVTDQNTNHSFLNIFSPLLYYSFQVVHQGDFSSTQENEFGIEPITFASHVYYFGNQHPATIAKPPDSVIRLYVGFSRSVQCDASGFPLPDVKWIRESGSPPAVRHNNSAILELNHVTKEHAGIYYCIAFNILVNPPKGRRDESDTWKITVIIEGLKIFTNHSTSKSSIEREDRAIALTLDINQDIPLGTTCRELAYSMMCHNVYPYCGAAPGKPTPRKLCKSVCQEFVSGQCKGYLSKSSPLYAMLAEGCDSRNYTGGESPECIPLSYEAHRNGQFESIEDTGDCIRGDGRGYSGSSYHTESVAVCQSWKEQTPHSHPMLPDLYRSDLDQAHFSCRNPGGIGKGPWCYTSDPIIRWEYCSIPQCDSCEMYIGETCRSFENYASINVTVKRSRSLQSQDAIEEKISLFFKSVLYLEPSEGCKDILRVLLCHGAFPQCAGTSTRQLCSVHCQFNQTLKDFCPNVFAEFSEFVASNRHFMNAPDCSLEDRDQCMTIPQLGNSHQLVVNNDCYEGNSVIYNGTIAETRDWIPCQVWDSQEPHSHPITSVRYPELQNSKNYCRNPGNLMKSPWCYTNDPKTVWDYCEVKHCEDIIHYSHSSISFPSSLSAPSSNASKANDDGILNLTSVIVVAGVVVIGVFLFLLFFTIIGCNFIFCRNKKAPRMRIPLPTINANPILKSYWTNNDYSKSVIPERKRSLVIPENFTLLDSKNVRYISQLGQGNFGIVFKGKAFGIKQFGDGEEDEGIDVAVKTLKEEATSEVKQDFIDEAKLMFNLNHPNILKIHGVCMNEMPYQLVFEYMDEGDLTKFLRSRASSQQRRLINPFSNHSRTESSYSDDPASLFKTELLYICKQISAGMKYLAENKHVHRDLACRNCLIKSDLVVKIGDFGMSRNLYSKDYYRINGKVILPVRWMSPESLIYGKFSIEGDVWSFGVVMWEVFSFALQPYYGISNEQVTEAVRKGQILSRPDKCPVEIYRLMKECWAMEPADRITFSELHERLCGLHHLYSVSSNTPTPDKDDIEGESSSEGSNNAFYSNETLDIQES